tara:strand:+ start:292 stop:504 length:213 start_codon:yes stop_codon:yes gene_type:complete
MDLLEREVSLMKQTAQSHCENIIKMAHFSDESQAIYMIMEYFNGGDLEKLLNLRGKFTENETRCFLSQIA